MGTDTKSRYILALIGVVFCSLALAVALTQRPGCDEAWFGGPAYNLAFHGSMGTPSLEPQTVFQEGRNFKGIDHYTYWIMPLSPLLQAGWYRIFGFSLMVMRSISLLWAIAALGAWWFLLRTWKMDSRMAILAIGLIALDYPFVRSAAHGRMDMMCAALNVLAFAAYFYYRGRKLAQAVFISQIVGACSFLTHPNGIFAPVGILIFALMFDLRRLRLWYVCVAAVPYLIGVGAWGLYIAQAPDIFWIQFGGNSAGRFWGLHDPVGALLSEFYDRYSGGSTGAAGLLKALQSAPYVLASLFVLSTRKLRENPALQAVLCLVAFESIYFWLMEGTKLYLYVVHTSPLFMVLLAASIFNVWETKRMPAWMISGALALWVTMQIGGVGFVARRNDMGKEYKPVVQFLQKHAHSGEVVMGSAELGFRYGFDGLVDDVKLGATSGKHPNYVVVENRYEGWQQRYAQAREPETYAHIQTVLHDDLRLVFEQGSYKIYGPLTDAVAH